jgi:regulator of PEP synthase PpsR (kinase-PPPase family)
MEQDKKVLLPPIYVVSGGKGLAGDAVVQSILIQYPNHKIPIIIVPDILSAEKALDVVDKSLETKGVIVHTMVDPEMRKILIQNCEAKNVKHFDLMGKLSDYLSDLLQTKPISKPGLYRLSNIEYFQRIEAIEYTLNHDDGMHSDKLANADIVLTGVSRTGKTPLSVYLAMFGWKVANVPLILGISPPEMLFSIDKNRVFALTITVNNLIGQRANRVRQLKMPEDTDYIVPRKVREEIDYAEAIFIRGGFTVIDITNKPIESSANEILTLLTGHFGSDNWKHSGGSGQA